MRTGQDIVVLPSVDSTNIYAMNEVHARMASHGKTYFALEQTAGKGQRGKQWSSRPGENILMSRVFDMGSRLPEKQFFFNMAIALGCYDFYKKYAGDEVSLKWPNDLYWRDRKAGGILVENLVQGKEWKWAVAGIGLNINQVIFDPSISRRPVSLRQITGREYELLDMVSELCACLDRRWDQFLSDPASLTGQYNEVLFNRGEMVKLRKGNRLFEALVRSVDDRGRLVVMTSVEERFMHGEVEFI